MAEEPTVSISVRCEAPVCVICVSLFYSVVVAMLGPACTAVVLPASRLGQRAFQLLKVLHERLHFRDFLLG